MIQDHKRFSTPYEAFVHRAWKAALLTGTQQYLLLTEDSSVAAPSWVAPQPAFLITAATVSNISPIHCCSGSFCDLNTLPMTLSQDSFASLLKSITPSLQIGSSLTFTYHGTQYTYRNMEQLLSRYGYLIYEHMNEEEIRDQFLLILASRRPQISVRGLNYCLAVKHRNIVI